MIWSRTILDGIVVCLIFNVTIALLWMLVPNAFSKMLPAEIRKASPKREKKEIIILASVMYPLYILIFIYMAVSARQAGVSGFWNLFWTGYVEMAFINFGDLIGLDGFMREHRDTMVEESLDNSIEMVLRLLEIYISGKGEIL